MAQKPFKLYQISGVDYTSIIATYRQLCEEGIMELDDSSLSTTGSFEPRYIYTKKPRKPLRDDTKVLNKAKYLSHTIAYRWSTTKDDDIEGVSVNMSILQDVLGEDAFQLLGAFIKRGYIKCSTQFSIGRFSRKYSPQGDIIIEPCTNFTIQKYIDKTKLILQANIAKQLSSPDFIAEYGETFASTYIKNLNKFKIKDLKGLESYAQAHPFSKKRHKDKRPYYDFIKEAFSNKLTIYSIDANGRIYHILSNLQTELKPYINIKYSIDCANSHPLLFNYFIYIYKGISISKAFHISQILCSLSNLHILSTDYSKLYTNAYFFNNYQPLHTDDESTHVTGIVPFPLYSTEILRIKLINNGIAKADIDKFEADELLYLWKTSCGILWDDILALPEAKGKTRSDVKKKMFAEVFYSTTDDAFWKRFCLLFKAWFPHVYDLVHKWKEPLSHPDTKAVLLRRHRAIKVDNEAWMLRPKTALPNIMMELESVIFRDILQALFRKRICAIHIHDAIVVPSVKSTESLDPEVICEIMRNTYKRFGLCPTLKIETY